MADNVNITAGAGTTIAADEAVDATLGTVKFQVVKIADGTLGGTDKLTITTADGALVNLGNNNDVTVTSGTITLGAGTAAVGKLAANSGVDIGDVDVTSVVPGVAATNLGKAEDAAHTSGDVGVMALAVRSDAQTVTAADGDYVPLLVNSAGALYVTGGGGGTQYVEDAAAAADPTGNAVILVRKDTPATVTTTDGDNIAQRGTNYGAAYVQLVTSAGAYIDSVGGGTQYAVDAALGATPTGTLAVGIRDDALSSLTPVEGDAIGLRVDANGALWVIPSGTVTVAGAVTVTNATAANLKAEATLAAAQTLATVTTVSTVTNLSQMAGAAIAMGTGARTAGTQRVTIATDDLVPVSIASVPSHAVTNAGTFAVQVDGAALTSLQLIDDVVFAEDAAHTTGDKGIMALSVRANSAAATSGTDGDYQPLITDTNGRLHVIEPSASGMATSLALIDDPVVQDDAAFTPATTKVMMAGFQADETATDSVDEGDGGAARMTLDRKQIVTTQPHTAGGLSIFRSLDLDETEEEVKGTAGCIYKIRIANASTSARYVKVYDNTAAGTTVGSTTPIDTIVVPGATSASQPTVITEAYGGLGITCSTGITVAATTALADADTGAPSANDVVCTVLYK